MTEAPPALYGRSVGGLAGRRLRFRPQLFWMEVLPEQAASSQLQFHLDFDSGRNLARLPSDRVYAPDGALAFSVARCVPDVDVDPDESEACARALREAATHAGGATPLRHLLSSCYCSRAVLAPALCEAARHGHVETAAMLLQAGADPSAQPQGKSALHIACEEGQEDVARVLLAANPAALTGAIDAVHGRTPLALARERDLISMARRLEAYVRELQTVAGAEGATATPS